MHTHTTPLASCIHAHAAHTVRRVRVVQSRTIVRLPLAPAAPCVMPGCTDEALRAAVGCGSTESGFLAYLYVNCILLLSSIAPTLLIMPIMIVRGPCLHRGWPGHTRTRLGRWADNTIALWPQPAGTRCMHTLAVSLLPMRLSWQEPLRIQCHAMRGATVPTLSESGRHSACAVRQPRLADAIRP
jgi:hypothetical protein